MTPKTPLELHREFYERRRQEMESRRLPRNHTEPGELSRDRREPRLPQPSKQNGHRQR